MIAAKFYFIIFLIVAFLGSWTTSADPGSALDMPPPLIAGISSVLFILMTLALFDKSQNARLFKEYQSKIIAISYFIISFYTWINPIYKYWDQAAFDLWGWGLIILIFIDLGACITVSTRKKNVIS
ncbi:hypothetical protein VFES401_13885 [Aliivibrio fischeri]|uniref:hypothetical protein n=1 Tax=Aliivibrio fischeri TaxID=668 RepID=UPI00107E66E7|nr:hypothetical protein [Aliivibrio fischeri]TGA67999.1 hypothetical protein VFES401_13885 [Aliivibrio fischeri]